MCGGGEGGCNFLTELVSKNALPPCSIHFKNCGVLDTIYNDRGLVVNKAGKAVSPPDRSRAGGGPGDEAPKRNKNLAFYGVKKRPKKHFRNAFLMCTIRTR